MKQLIKQIISTKPNNSISIHLKKLINFDDYLESSDYRNIYELIFCFKNNINNIPICEYPECNNFKFFNTTQKKYSRGCCRNHSTKITCLEKYGVDNPSKSKIIKEKIINVIKSHHGGKHHMQTEKYKKYFSEVSKKTAEITIKKTKETCLKKYGVEHYFLSDDYKQKTEETYLKKHGTKHNWCSGTISRKKRNKTMKEKYGVEYALQNKKIRKKTKEKYLRTTFYNRLETILEKYEPMFDMNVYFGMHIPYKWKCKKCNNKFYAKINNGLPLSCPVCYPKVRSKLEKDVIRSLKSFNNINQNIRRIKDNNGKIIEFDIEIENKLFIELNGNFWHSERNLKNKNYHLHKTIVANSNNRQLLHFFEDECKFKLEIVISIIEAKLGKFSNKISARKCNIEHIDTKTKNKFLENCHLKGKDDSCISLGLIYNNVLVSILTFSKNTKHDEYEISRFCSAKGYQILGGFSKLWSYFIKTFKPSLVKAFLDKRYSTNTDMFESLGFYKLEDTPPNFYVMGKNKLLRECIMDLKNLEKYNTNLSMWENLKINNFDRIWDCGNFVIEWKKQ